ncbi:MAG: hypothetical protein U5J83_17050 [Bryobacterales bacterium]|nr:hypothetical protein [Bryobacterales bacterium]
MPISPAAVPELIEEMVDFFSRMGSMGAEVAFWRAKSNGVQLAKFKDALSRLCHHPTYLQEPAPRIAGDIRAFEDLHQRITALVGQIPFESKVDLIHRSLIPVYQQVYVLDNLVMCLLVRLRQRGKGSLGLSLQAGSLLSVESRREMRERFRESAPSWDRKDWNLYDDL